MTAVGLATLPPGAPVACETASAAPGPEVFGMPAAYARGSSGRAARPPASATAHDRWARMTTTKG